MALRVTLAKEQNAELRRPTCSLSLVHTNQLSGTIPSSLGSLTGLQQLCVHRTAGRPCTSLR